MATSTLVAGGDGTYTSAPTTLDRAGYYSYRESIAATAAYPGATTACGEVSETTFTRAAPAVTTIVSNQVVRPGARIFDRISVTGLGRTHAQGERPAVGPYASRAAMTCAGAPYWKGTVAVKRRRRGALAARCAWRGRASTPIASGSPVNRLIDAVQTPCGEEIETSLGAAADPDRAGGSSRPCRAGAFAAITVTGSQRASASAASALTAEPTRVALRRLGIDAAIYGVGIDTRLGVLDVPPNIDRVGWWRDGALPGATGRDDPARGGRRQRAPRSGARSTR